MLEESDRAWDKIGSRSYAFHALRDECAHLRLISLQQVGCGMDMGCRMDCAGMGCSCRDQCARLRLSLLQQVCG